MQNLQLHHENDQNGTGSNSSSSLFTNGHSYETPSPGWGNNNEQQAHSRTLRLGDGRKSVILVAPSTGECSLWIRRIIEAKKHFVENEKSRLMRQRSSKYAYCYHSWPMALFQSFIERIRSLLAKFV